MKRHRLIQFGLVLVCLAAGAGLGVMTESKSLELPLAWTEDPHAVEALLHNKTTPFAEA